MHFGPWEIVAFGTLYIGSFLLATDVGLRMSPRIQKRFSFIPRLQDSGWWAFTPFVMLTVAGAIFLARATGFLSDTGGSVIPAPGPAAAASGSLWLTVFLVYVFMMLTPFVLGGLVLLFDAATRNRPAFNPVSGMISLNEIEFNTKRLNQPAPWLELNLTFFNATGHNARPLEVSGRVIVSGQEFHARIELVDLLQSYPYGEFFKTDLKIPVSTSEAQHCLETIKSSKLSVEFSDAHITFGITIYGLSGPSPVIGVPLPKKVSLNRESLRTDPYLPWQMLSRR